MTELEHDRSGLTLAEQAHAAGAVEPPAVALPSYDVELRFVVRGSHELAMLVVDNLEGHLLGEPAVAEYSAVVAEAV